MADVLSVGISPCPNDTFIFNAWLNGLLGVDAPRVTYSLHDISTLNEMAFQEVLDVAKVSFYAYAAVSDRYALLNAGGAMGRGCGPLLVSRPGNPAPKGDALCDMTVAVPGQWTTANLLLSLRFPTLNYRVYMPFGEILPAVAGGTVDAGLVIHEGRFTYASYGLSMIEDLGAWWERVTGLPIPLGGIIARRSLGEPVIRAVENAVLMSLRAALAQPEKPRAFMKRHAREMDDDAMRQHVSLYVNDYSLDFGTEGRRAIEKLLLKAALLTGACLNGDEEKRQHSRNG